MRDVPTYLDFFRIGMHETSWLVVEFGVVAHRRHVSRPVLDRLVLVLLGLVLVGGMGWDIQSARTRRLV